MDGYGCTGWRRHNKRLAVEDCRKLPMQIVRAFIQQGGRRGSVSWNRGGEPMGDISYYVTGGQEPVSLRLIETQNGREKGFGLSRTAYEDPTALGMSSVLVHMSVGRLRSAREYALSAAARRVFRLPALLPPLVSVKAGGTPGPHFLQSHGGAYAGYSPRCHMAGYERGFKGLIEWYLTPG